MTSLRACMVFMALVLYTVLPTHAQAPAEPAVALRGIDVVGYFKDGPGQRR
ncbi:MAG: hypothetical protein ACRET7_02060 [Burkholderiales bacterium]